MGFFGMIGHAVKHFGSFAKHVWGKFGHLINSRGKEQQQNPDVPNAPALGYPVGTHPQFQSNGKIMLEKAKEKYGGVHINPNSYHLAGLQNI